MILHVRGWLLNAFTDMIIKSFEILTEKCEGNFRILVNLHDTARVKYETAFKKCQIFNSVEINSWPPNSEYYFRDSLLLNLLTEVLTVSVPLLDIQTVKQKQWNAHAQNYNSLKPISAAYSHGTDAQLSRHFCYYNYLSCALLIQIRWQITKIINL